VDFFKPLNVLDGQFLDPPGALVDFNVQQFGGVVAQNIGFFYSI
jgi:hypothetical protein